VCCDFLSAVSDYRIAFAGLELADGKKLAPVAGRRPPRTKGFCNEQAKYEEGNGMTRTSLLLNGKPLAGRVQFLPESG